MTKNHTFALKPAQLKAVVALAATGEIKQAAIESGTSRNSIYAWMQNPAFVAALADVQSAMHLEVSQRLAGLATVAVDTMAEIVTNSELPPGVRLRAADSILARAVQFRDSESFEDRFKMLRKREEFEQFEVMLGRTPREVPWEEIDDE